MKAHVVQMGIVVAALVLGEAVALSLPEHIAGVWPIVFWALVPAALFGYGYAGRHAPMLVFFLLGLALAFRAQDAQYQARMEITLARGPYTGVFEVLSEPRAFSPDEKGNRWVSFSTTYPLGPLKVVFNAPATNALPQLGEKWQCTGYLGRASERRRGGTRLWVNGRKSSAVRVRAANPRSWTVLRTRIKRELSRRMGLGLEDRPVVAALNRAMLLGERAQLPAEMRDDFVRAGTIHVFAISGLHVMAVAQFLSLALALLMFPIRWVGLVVIPALWLYVLLIGAPASAVRAAAMASIYAAAPIFWRRPDSLAAWELTVMIFALVDPIALFGVGSLLSFVVMLGILLCLRWAKAFGHRRWVAGVCIPFAAWAAGVPIAARVFARVTPGGLLANIVLVPTAFGAVTASALGVVASFVSTRLAEHINNAAALFTQAMAGISWLVARLPGSNMEIAPWSVWCGAAWYVGILLLFLWVRMVYRRRHATLA